MLILGTLLQPCCTPIQRSPLLGSLSSLPLGTVLSPIASPRFRAFFRLANGTTSLGPSTPPMSSDAQSILLSDEALQEQRPSLAAVVAAQTGVHHWFSITNDFSHLLRIVTYVVRACDCFKQVLEPKSSSPPTKRCKRYPDKPLTVTTRLRSTRTQDTNFILPLSDRGHSFRLCPRDFFACSSRFDTTRSEGCFFSGV